MSSSARAKKRRLRRKQLTKYQRGLMANQHWGDKYTLEKQRRLEKDNKLAAMLGLNKQ